MTTTLGSLRIPACRVDSGAEDVLAQVEDLGLGVSCAEHRRRNLRAKLLFASLMCRTQKKEFKGKAGICNLVLMNKNEKRGDE